MLLATMGFLGVLAQAFKKMNELNRRNNGDFSFNQYLKIERFSLGMSLIVVVASVLFIYMVPELQKAGKWLVGGQFSIGWFGQSGLEFLMGQAKKHIGVKTGSKEDEMKNLST